MTAEPSHRALWDRVAIDPVEVALPGDVVGVTLRAYRTVGELRGGTDDADTAVDTAADDGDTYVPDPADFEDGPPPDEEVPLFLSHEGQLLLFGTADALVEFVRSGSPHELTQLPEWSTVVDELRPEHLEPAEEDTYALNLVVENLRGGPGAWDLSLLIAAGEFARDAGYALRLASVIDTLAPGSPLDDLDDTLRAAAGGGFSGVLARRRLRRFGVQQASLGWRNVIGKIAAATKFID